MNKNEELPPIAQTTYINAPPHQVYKILTTSEGWDSWFTNGTEVDPNPGGKIILRWKNFGTDHLTIEDGGKVLKAEKNTCFSFEWFPTTHATKVQFTVESLGEGTLLKLRETGYLQTEDDLRAHVECAAGWGEALTLLKFYIEHGIKYGPVPHVK